MHVYMICHIFLFGCSTDNHYKHIETCYIPCVCVHTCICVWSMYAKMKREIAYLHLISIKFLFSLSPAKEGKRNAWHSSSTQFSFISSPSASSRHLHFPCHLWLHQTTPFFSPSRSHKGQPRKHASLHGDSTAFIMRSPASALLVCLWLLKLFFSPFLFFSSTGFFLLSLSHCKLKVLYENFYETLNKELFFRILSK